MSRLPVTGGRIRRDRVWLIFLVASVVAIGIYELVPRGIVHDAIYFLIGLVSAAAIVVGIRINRPRRVLPWALMAVGQLIWSLGDATGAWLSDVAGINEFPAPSDGLYLSAYPLLIIGFWLLVRSRQLGPDPGGTLDSLAVTAGLALLYWVLLAKPTLLAHHASTGAAVIAGIYPFADILLIAGLVRLLTIPLRHSRSLRLLLAAVGTLIVADTLATALQLLTFASTEAFDFLWLVSYVAWGCAALHPSMRQISEPPRSAEVNFSRVRLVVLMVAVLTAPGVLAVEQWFGVPLNVWGVVVGSVVMFVLVVTRLGLGIGYVLRVNGERAEVQDELARQATHDSLTGLPNRAQAKSLIAQALGRAQRSGALIGLLFIDLDGFKAVNDSLGHSAGDEVLSCVATRMQETVRNGDVVARQGGDEFLVLLEPLDEDSSAIVVAQRLVDAISAPITLSSGRKTWVGASVGVALSQDARTDPEVLLNEADVAVYRAKDTGRGGIEVFDEALRRELAERNALEIGIAAAIANDELVLHYQPILSVRSGTVEGWEALVRWQRPGFGLLQPAEFIPVAERSDLICDLDSWVLREAARQLRVWSTRQRRPAAATEADPETVMNVNIAARHVTRSRIVDDVALALAEAGLEPRRLVLEVSETALLNDPAALTNLADLRTLGVLITMDDFGTQYSSIARLGKLPVDSVKIDRSFLQRTDESSRLLPLIIEAAHAFQLSVIAEGVENADQLAALQAGGCESAQGFLLGRPAAPTEVGAARPISWARTD